MNAAMFLIRRLGLLAANPGVQIAVIAVTALAQASKYMKNRQELPAPAGSEPKAV